MRNYYLEKLHSQNLFKVYNTNLPRIKQYLQAEVDFVKKDLSETQNVLEIGAGYGRIVKELAPYCNSIVGIDISKENVALGKAYLAACTNAVMVEMDAHKVNFEEKFDVVLCLQNGLSSIRGDFKLVEKMLAMLAPNGTAYFSTYSCNFWKARLQWFEEQADKGLLGKIDYDKTQNGVIVCTDGFRATTFSLDDFRKIGEQSLYAYDLHEVDDSSVFLVIHKI